MDIKVIVSHNKVTVSSEFNIQAGSTPELHASIKPPFSLQQVTTPNTPSNMSTSSVTSPTSSFSSPLFIPVSCIPTLRTLRSSLPDGLSALAASGVTVRVGKGISGTFQNDLWIYLRRGRIFMATFGINKAPGFDAAFWFWVGCLMPDPVLMLLTNNTN